MRRSTSLIRLELSKNKVLVRATTPLGYRLDKVCTNLRKVNRFHRTAQSAMAALPVAQILTLSGFRQWAVGTGVGRFIRDEIHYA